MDSLLGEGGGEREMEGREPNSLTFDELVALSGEKEAALKEVKRIDNLVGDQR